MTSAERQSIYAAYRAQWRALCLEMGVIRPRKNDE